MNLVKISKNYYSVIVENKKIAEIFKERRSGTGKKGFAGYVAPYHVWAYEPENENENCKIFEANKLSEVKNLLADYLGK